MYKCTPITQRVKNASPMKMYDAPMKMYDSPMKMYDSPAKKYGKKSGSCSCGK
jgi:hypothetical protein